MPVWRGAQTETGDEDAALPYWAFAWIGGLAIARHLEAYPEVVSGDTVFDLASGSGLCAIAAMRAGATHATAADIDPYAVAAIALNARANGTRVSVVRRDVLDEDPPDVEVVLAGDCWYETGLAERATAWLRRVRTAGIEVLLGDPGRRYLPIESVVELARYDVRTTTVLEDLEHKQGYVFALRDD